VDWHPVLYSKLHVGDGKLTVNSIFAGEMQIQSRQESCLLTAFLTHLSQRKIEETEW